MTEDAVYNALIGYLNGVNSLSQVLGNPGQLAEIVRGYQGKARAKDDYATVTLQSERDLEEVDCDLYRDATIAGQPRAIHDKFRAHEWLFRIEIYSARPTDAARVLTTALRANEAGLALAPLVVRRVYPAITASAAQVGQFFEGRANVDVSIGGIVKASVPTDLIEHVSLGVHSVRPDGMPGFDADTSL